MNSQIIKQFRWLRRSFYVPRQLRWLIVICRVYRNFPKASDKFLVWQVNEAQGVFSGRLDKKSRAIGTLPCLFKKGVYSFCLQSRVGGYW